MVQLDKIHNAVKNALIKDGWEITAENFEFRFKEFKLDGDLEAQKIDAEKRIDKIFIKINNTFSASTMSDFEHTLGQFLLYRVVLSEIKPDFKTYLAFSEYNYNRFYDSRAIRTFIEEEKLSIIVVNLEDKTITKWDN